MRRLPKDGSFEKMDGASWASPTRIPPEQSVGVAFQVPYKLSDFKMSSVDIDQGAFLRRRLKEIDGMAFFDYASKYKVEMPRTWDEPKEPAKN